MTRPASGRWVLSPLRCSGRLLQSGSKAGSKASALHARGLTRPVLWRRGASHPLYALRPLHEADGLDGYALQANASLISASWAAAAPHLTAALRGRSPACSPAGTTTLCRCRAASRRACSPSACCWSRARAGGSSWAAAAAPRASGKRRGIRRGAPTATAQLSSLLGSVLC